MAENTNKHHYAVIMAGGSGTRMWPMSRKNSPKQFHALHSSQTMLQLMYWLLRETFAPGAILVQTDKKFVKFVTEQLPELPPENILLEPEARDTAPAFGYATASILKRDPYAKIGVFYSDHIVKNKEKFVQAVETAYQAVEDFPKHIVMIGVKPTYAHTGLGYIQMGSEAKQYEDGEVFHVERFLEKPDAKTAESFVQSWEYLWNTGYKVYTGAHFFNLMEKVHPEMVGIFHKMIPLFGRDDTNEQIETMYQSLPRISFEFLVTEQMTNLLVIPSDMGWSDIGDWKALHDIMVEVKGHHMITKGNHVGVECQDCLVYGGERMIATLGLKDIVIVDTGDAILIANKHYAQDMKKLVTKLEEQDKHVYL